MLDTRTSAHTTPDESKLLIRYHTALPKMSSEDPTCFYCRKERPGCLDVVHGDVESIPICSSSQDGPESAVF